MAQESVWGFGQSERSQLPTISGLDVEKALTLIRDKIRGRLEGGPSEVRVNLLLAACSLLPAALFKWVSLACRLANPQQLAAPQLRRAFQFFDADGSGSIDHEEMRQGLRIRTNLEFSDQMVSEIMSKFDEGTGKNDEFCIKIEDFCIKNDESCIKNEKLCIEYEGTGEIDFNKFANLVMDSSNDSKTGWTSPTKGGKNLGFDHFMVRFR